MIIFSSVVPSRQSPIDYLNANYEPVHNRFIEYCSIVMLFIVASALIVYFFKALIS